MYMHRRGIERCHRAVEHERGIRALFQDGSLAIDDEVRLEHIRDIVSEPDVRQRAVRHVIPRV
jgi:hypothetical protein